MPRGGRRHSNSIADSSCRGNRMPRANSLARRAGLARRHGDSDRVRRLARREARLPIERDTIFRIASMTKPITSAAALMLLEEGRFALDDPIARGRRSSRRCASCGRRPVRSTTPTPADRPITFDDLLTHRSGLTYGGFWPGPLADAPMPTRSAATSTATWRRTSGSRGLPTLPLIDQPGAAPCTTATRPICSAC